MIDPAEIDLKAVKGCCSDIPNLIAAVEALRERVEDLEEQNITIRRRNGAYAEGMADANDRAEAAEARLAALDRPTKEPAP